MAEKTCKICGKKRYANTSWCYYCYRKREKAKKEEKAKRKLERKQSTKKYQNEIKKKLHNKVWKLMSEYIRSKDADQYGFNYCYTCGEKKHYKELQAGHYKHDRLDFDERNLKPQCSQCNHYNYGRLDVYGEKLANQFGLDWVNKLTADAWKHQGYDIEEMLEIEKDLKEKLEVIRNKYE